MLEWTLCPHIALLFTHLRGEEDGPGVLEEDEEVAGLVGGREERDEVGHAQQWDDDEERLGRLQVLVVLRLGVVGPQLAAHHLRRRKRERGLSAPTHHFTHPRRLTPIQFSCANDLDKGSQMNALRV